MTPSASEKIPVGVLKKNDATVKQVTFLCLSLPADEQNSAMAEASFWINASRAVVLGSLSLAVLRLFSLRSPIGHYREPGLSQYSVK